MSLLITVTLFASHGFAAPLVVPPDQLTVLFSGPSNPPQAYEGSSYRYAGWDNSILYISFSGDTQPVRTSTSMSVHMSGYGSNPTNGKQEPGLFEITTYDGHSLDITLEGDFSSCYVGGQGFYPQPRLAPDGVSHISHIKYGEYFYCNNSSYAAADFKITKLLVDQDPDLSIGSIMFSQPPGMDVPVDPVSKLPILIPGQQAVVTATIYTSFISYLDTRTVNVTASINGRIVGSYPVTLGWMSSGIYQQPIWFTPQAGDGQYPLVMTVDPENAFGDVNVSNNSLSASFTSPHPNLEITSVRAGQTVFDPAAGLITGKSFAIEIAFQATNLSGLNDVVASAQLFSNNVAVSDAVDFKPSSINSTFQRLYLYSQSSVAGLNTLEIRIKPKSGAIPMVLDDTHFISKSISYTFLTNSLNVLTGKISNCATGIDCFKSPSATALANFTGLDRDLASQLLPVSTDKLQWIGGPDITNSTPANLGPSGWYAYRDLFRIWRNKKAAGANIATYVADPSYWISNGINAAAKPDDDTYGVSLFKTSIVDTRMQATLTHEMMHDLGQKHANNNETNVEGINASIQVKSVFSNVTAIDAATKVQARSASNIMLATPYDFESGVLIAPSAYAEVTNSIHNQLIDPPAIILSGAVDQNGKVLFQDFERMLTTLDVSTGSDIQLQGLDSNGRIVSSVSTSSETTVSRFGNSGADEFTVGGYAFAATLPDTGNITTVQVLKTGKLISSISVAQNTVSNVLSRLVPAGFKISLLARVELSLIRDQYSAYLKLLAKNKKLEAKVTLALMRLTVAETLKSSITLSDGKNLELKDFLMLINDEFNSIR